MIDPAVPCPAIFLQPHYDDVALSCGGLVAQYASAGAAVHLITVFASEILPAMIGEFADAKHRRWKIDHPAAVDETRRAEDQAAAQELGCPLRWLGFPDAIYRGDRYGSEAALFGEIHSEEQLLPTLIAEEVQTLPEWQTDTTVFVPLGVGSHADHLLLFESGRVLAAAGVPVFAYEDCPYAIHHPYGTAERLKVIGGYVGNAVIAPTPKTVETRIAAISCYRSQLPAIFRYTDDYAGSIRDFACAIGGGQAAERFWPVLPAEPK